MSSSSKFRNPYLSGIGTITAAKRASDKFAIGSAFRLLTQPPARAAYAGQSLRQRIAIYAGKSPIPVAHYDRIKYPINDIAFHPTEPVVAIATGSYDGGFSFEGELIVWNWDSNQVSHEMAETPEVFRVAFDKGGMSILCAVRPWDENEFEHGEKIFDKFYEVRLTYTSNLDLGIVNSKAVNKQMMAQEPLTEGLLNSDPRFKLEAPPLEAVQNYFENEDLLLRSPIWDVAILDDGNIGIVHDETHLDLFSQEGELVNSLKGNGHGVQILKGDKPIIHVINRDITQPNWSSLDTRLFQFDDNTLSEKLQYDGIFTFSISRDGTVIGRRNRSGSVEPLNDLVTSSDLTSWKEYDFGHYDVFNHFVRIDNSPYNFIVQGNPPSSYGYKVLSVINDTMEIKTIWPIIRGNKPDTKNTSKSESELLSPLLLFRKDGTHPKHAMECYFAYVQDNAGEGILGTGMYYKPSPSGEARGFLYRKPLSKDEPMWSHDVKAACSVIKQIPHMPFAVAAFLDGLVYIIHTDTGKILHKNLFELNQLPNVVFSLDCSVDEVVFGTMTGEFLSVDIGTLIEHGLSMTR